MNTHTPPTPKQKHWLLGHIPYMMKDIMGYMAKIQKEYGNIVSLQAPVEAGKMYVITDSDALQRVLLDNNKNYTKGNFLDLAKPVMGQGLVTSEGDYWRKQRRLIQPTFHRDSIKSMLEGMNECIEELLTDWGKLPEGALLDLTKEMDKLALKVVAKSLFKINVDHVLAVLNDQFKYLLSRMMSRFKNPIAYARWIPTPANRKETRAIRILNETIFNIIRRRKEGIDPPQNDILDMFLSIEDEDGEKMTDQQLKDELITLIIAGYETSARAMSFLFYSLAENPAIYNKVLKISDQIDVDKDPESIRKAPYLQQIIQEILRLYPPGFIINRQAIESDQFGPYTVPKRMNITIPIFVIHRMAEYWPDPDTFDPERFSPERIKDIPKFAYFPFGRGPRLCIGDQFAQSEMLLTLVKVTQRFIFKNECNYQLELEPQMALGARDHVTLNLYSRNIQSKNTRKELVDNIIN